MFRALQIADKYGLDNAQGIAADSPPNMLVNNMVREFFAEINSCCNSCFGNLCLALFKDAEPNTK